MVYRAQIYLLKMIEKLILIALLRENAPILISSFFETSRREVAHHYGAVSDINHNKNLSVKTRMVSVMPI